jgi:DNA polymerase-1
MLLLPRFASMVTSDGTPSGGVFGFLKSLRSLITKLEGADRIITVFDRGSSKRRLEIFPGYRVRPPREEVLIPGKGMVGKEKAEDVEEALPYHEVFGTQRGIIKEWMVAMGTSVIRLKDREADDIIYQLTALDEGDHLCIIVSDDKDFLQLLSPSVHVYRAIADEYFDPSKFEKKWGFPRKKYLMYKALIGDPSDMVPGIKGIGDKSALEIVNAVSKSKEVVAYCKEHKRKNFRNVATPESVAILKRNIQLFDMRKEEFTRAEMRKIEKALRGKLPKVDWGTLRRIASELEFSIAANLGQWMRAFKAK